MIFLLKVLATTFVGLSGEIHKAFKDAAKETESERLRRIMRQLPVKDACVLAALATAPDIDVVLDVMEPEEIERMWILIETIKMELREDLPRFTK